MSKNYKTLAELRAALVAALDPSSEMGTSDEELIDGVSRKRDAVYLLVELLSLGLPALEQHLAEKTAALKQATDVRFKLAVGEKTAGVREAQERWERASKAHEWALAMEKLARDLRKAALVRNAPNGRTQSILDVLIEQDNGE